VFPRGRLGKPEQSVAHEGAAGLSPETGTAPGAQFLGESGDAGMFLSNAEGGRSSDREHSDQACQRNNS